MEPNNIENDFRKKLSEREIQPSPKAWDRLDAMLAVVDSGQGEKALQKNRRNYNWMYVAASLLGFVLIATVFLTQDQEMVDVGKDSIVLDHPSETVPDSNVEPSDVTKEIDDAIATTKSETKVPVKDETVQLVSNPKQANSVSQSESAVVPNSFAVTFPSETLEKKTKNEDRLANRYVDVDALLASVESPQTKEKLFKNDSPIRVDSNKLLSEVDGELELSFREKVIQSVSKNYQEVKVALGNRNLKD